MNYYYSFTISFLAICFLASVLIAFRDFTLHDQLLPNKHFKSFPVKDWLKCVQVCHSVPSCISYNYDANSHNSCQLHKCGFRDRCTACGNLYVSAGAIFHQLRPTTNDALCDYTPLESAYPVFIGSSSASQIAPPSMIEPAVCSYDKNASNEQLLHAVTICGKKNHHLNSCAGRNPIRLISVQYSKCTCLCDTCKLMNVSEACIPPDDFNKIAKKCEGKMSCKVKRKDEPCSSSGKLSIHIKYSCDALGNSRSGNNEGASSHDDEVDREHDVDDKHGDERDDEHGSGDDEEDDDNHDRNKGAKGG